MGAQMGIPSGAFPGASATTTPAIYPTGSSGNQLQATGFIPEIWSGKLVEKFYASTVLAAISNTDYEGEIKNKGDRVKIRTKPTITIHNYDADGLLGLDRPTGGTVELYIGNGKYFSVILDDVMEVQSDLNILSMWSDDAAQQLKISVDTDVLSGIVGQMAAANQGTAAGVITGSLNLGVQGAALAVVGRNAGTGQVELLDVLMRMGQVLDEQNIPEVGRWVVFPAWAGRMIKQSELRQAYLSGDSVSMLRNGRLGMVDRFHALRLKLAAEQQLGLSTVQLWRVANFRWTCAWAHVRLANLESGDAQIRVNIWADPPWLAGVRVSSSGRPSFGAGAGDASFVIYNRWWFVN